MVWYNESNEGSRSQKFLMKSACTMVWYGAVWFDAVRYGVCGKIWCGMVRYCVVRYGVVWYGVLKEVVRSESGGCQELDPTLTIRAEQANPNLYTLENI